MCSRFWMVFEDYITIPIVEVRKKISKVIKGIFGDDKRKRNRKRLEFSKEYYGPLGFDDVYTASSYLANVMKGRKDHKTTSTGSEFRSRELERFSNLFYFLKLGEDNEAVRTLQEWAGKKFIYPPEGEIGLLTGHRRSDGIR